jgi:hypothetical protein
MDEPPAAAPEPEPATGTALPRTARRPRHPPRRRKGLLAVIALLIAVFAAAAWWLASSTVPYVTHREAIRMAVAIEGATSLEQLRALIADDVPALPDLPVASGSPPGFDNVAGRIWWHKTECKFTFLGLQGDRSAGGVLPFRSLFRDLYVDYVELRLEKRNGEVRVVDLRSFSLFGMWWTEALRQLERVSAWGLPAAVLASRPPESTAVDFETLLGMLRAAPEQDRQLVLVLGTELAARFFRRNADYSSLRQHALEFRTRYPDNLTADVMVLYEAVTAFVTNRLEPLLRKDALAALDRLHARFGDEAYIRPLQERLRN